MNKIVYFIAFILIFIGCGTQSGTTSTNRVTTPLVESNIDKESKNYFGYLSGATINIYSLGDGKKELLYSEKSSSGSSLDEIGNFNAHLNELDSKKFYLFEVSGGYDWDSDHNKIIDKSPTENKNRYRAIKRGSKNHLSWWNRDIVAVMGKEIPEEYK